MEQMSAYGDRLLAKHLLSSTWEELLHSYLAVVLLLLIYCFMLWGFSVGPCFGIHYFVSFLVLQSS